MSDIPQMVEPSASLHPTTTQANALNPPLSAVAQTFRDLSGTLSGQTPKPELRKLPVCRSFPERTTGLEPPTFGLGSSRWSAISVRVARYGSARSCRYR
jgi:hypothetical protein